MRMRLNVFLAKSGFCSRRKAASFIKSGKVSVNGRIILEPWHELHGSESVKIQGKALSEIPITQNFEGSRVLNVTVMKKLGITPKPITLLGTQLVKTKE